MDINRREFLATVAAAQGAFVLGFWAPQKASAQTAQSQRGSVWYEEPATPEVNATERGLPLLVLDRAYIDQSAATTATELIQTLPQAQNFRSPAPPRRR